MQSIENFFAGKSNGKNSLDIEDESTSNPERAVISRENKIMLKNAINSLPENQRIAFILSKSQDLSYKEISEVMSVSLPSVESLLFRAKANLQKNLTSELKKK